MDDHDLLLETMQRCKSNTHRIDTLEQNYTLLHQMASNLEVLANEQGHISKKVEEIDDKVQRIEAKPSKRWDAVITAAITGIVGILAGAIIGLVVM